VNRERAPIESSGAVVPIDAVVSKSHSYSAGACNQSDCRENQRKSHPAPQNGR
jgi:hypothetical protein